MKSVWRKADCLSVVLICLVSVLLAVGGPACRKETPTAPDANAAAVATPDESAAPDEASAPAPAEPDPASESVVATVNGYGITEAVLRARADELRKQVGSKLDSLPEALAAQFNKKIRTEALNVLITERLLWEQVEAAGIEVADGEILAEIEKLGSARQPPMTVESFKALVEAQGGNFEDVKDQFRRNLSYRKLMETRWAGELEVAEEQARKYFEEHSADYDEPEQVRASHILIKPATSDPNTDPNGPKLAARAKAEKLLEEIKGGADFAELARAHSGCISAREGGDVKFFARGAMVPPFEEAAFALAPGEMSDVVETRFGYHIIKVTDRKDAKEATFDDAQEAIVEKLQGEKRSAITNEYIKSLRAEAVIEYASPDEPESDEPAPAVTTEG
jgi:peptidyl-prolyl cis-trans isomerase C